MAKKKKGLGRGLGALISSNAATDRPDDLAMQPDEPAGPRLLLLNPRDLKPNPKQPRMTFDEEALEELSESIKRDGVQEPVIVRKAGDGYELVSGERRVRAAVMAYLETIPAVWREVALLHGARVAHGKLDGRHLIVDGTRAQIVSYDYATSSARFRQTGGDVAQVHMPKPRFEPHAHAWFWPRAYQQEGSYVVHSVSSWIRCSTRSIAGASGKRVSRS